MDFLDPKKQKQHAIRIWIGYALIGVALLLATTVLLYQAYGYRINREGEIIQNGLVFMSSRPEGAMIYANGNRLDDNTNARLSLAAGQYTFELVREGYHTWKRGITVEGGSVQRFVYPFLFPADLRTSSVHQYEDAPVLSTQSLDGRWLLVFKPSDAFDIYDLDNDEPVAQERTIPTEVLAANSTTLNWREVQWADSNRHVVLQRIFKLEGQDNEQTEYILYDREDPSASRNLTNLLGFNPTKLQLRDAKYDQYYAFDSNSQVLFTASLNEPTPKALLRDVLDFESDGPESVLYATNKGAPDDKTLFRLSQNEQSYTIRQAPRSDSFVMGLADFNGVQIVAAGVRSENRVFVYQDPLSDLSQEQVAVPLQILKVDNPSQLKFSKNARFAMIQNGNNFAVYDAETDRGYAYQLDLPENTNPTKASWMDGHRMVAVNQDKFIVFDYDGTNLHDLMPGRRGFKPAFNPAYTLIYGLSLDNKLNVGHLRTADDE